MSWLEGGLCTLQPSLCLNILSALAGYSPGNINASQLPMYLQYTPAGTSVQNMVHWCQVGAAADVRAVRSSVRAVAG